MLIPDNLFWKEKEPQLWIKSQWKLSKETITTTKILYNAYYNKRKTAPRNLRCCNLTPLISNKLYIDRIISFLYYQSCYF